MSYALHPGLPIPSTCRLPDLPRQAQFLLLTLRLAHELSVDHRYFQGFVYALYGISRVERALMAVKEVLRCLGSAPGRLTIGSAVSDDIADDERRLLELLRGRRDFALARAGAMVPPPLDEALIAALNGLADMLE